MSNMNQEPDVDAAKARLENAFQKSLRHDSSQIVRVRIIQTYALLGGDVDTLKEIEDDVSRLCTCDDPKPMRTMAKGTPAQREVCSCSGLIPQDHP